MKKILLLTLIFLLSTSFKTKEIALKLGDYGVCSCENQEENNIKLTFKTDNAFSYQEITDGNKVTCKGSFITKGKEIKLIPTRKMENLALNWRIDDNAKAIKSRNKLSFIRLVHLESCK